VILPQIRGKSGTSNLGHQSLTHQSKSTSTILRCPLALEATGSEADGIRFFVDHSGLIIEKRKPGTDVVSLNRLNLASPPLLFKVATKQGERGEMPLQRLLTMVAAFMIAQIRINPLSNRQSVLISFWSPLVFLLILSVVARLFRSGRLDGCLPIQFRSLCTSTRLGPRDAQRDAQFSEVAPQAHSIRSLVPGNE
jgi:hypothetical protein